MKLELIKNIILITSFIFSFFGFIFSLCNFINHLPKLKVLHKEYSNEAFYFYTKKDCIALVLRLDIINKSHISSSIGRIILQVKDSILEYSPYDPNIQCLDTTKYYYLADAKMPCPVVLTPNDYKSGYIIFFVTGTFGYLDVLDLSTNDVPKEINGTIKVKTAREAHEVHVIFRSID